MVSQLLFGELFEIVERTPKWVRVRSAYDAYEGWIDSKQFLPVDADAAAQLKEMDVLPLGVSHTLHVEPAGAPLIVVAGSNFPIASGGKLVIGDKTFLLESEMKTADYQFPADIRAVSSFYLNAPYLWGGRSLFGIDCSGFTQMVLKQFKIKLKRDAWQQAEQGEVVDFLPAARPGDLAFFENEEGRIVHVGIILEAGQIIHASGKVRVDQIDDEGIFNVELKRHTHKLRIIRRFSVPTN